MSKRSNALATMLNYSQIEMINNNQRTTMPCCANDEWPTASLVYLTYQ